MRTIKRKRKQLEIKIALSLPGVYGSRAYLKTAGWGLKLERSFRRWFWQKKKKEEKVKCLNTFSLNYSTENSDIYIEEIVRYM